MRLDRTDLAGLADEYVLGLLEANEARAIDAEIDGDPALRAAIAASRERFLPLDDAAVAAIVDDGLWDRIAAALPSQQAPAAGSSSSPATPPTPPTPGASITPGNDNVPRRWRTTALAALAASLVLALALTVSLALFMRPTGRAEPLVVAVLVDAAGEVRAVVEDFGNERASVRMLWDFEVPPGKTIEAWTLPSPERGPVSLGRLEAPRSADLHGPALPMPRESQLYELTLEQAGGSPTGRPTGLILAKGFAKLTR